MIILSKPDEISCYLLLQYYVAEQQIEPPQGKSIFLKYHVTGQKPGVELTTPTPQTPCQW